MSSNDFREKRAAGLDVVVVAYDASLPERREVFFVKDAERSVFFARAGSDRIRDFTDVVAAEPPAACYDAERQSILRRCLHLTPDFIGRG